MGRKWINSKGIGIDSDSRKERELNQLRRDLIQKKNYNKNNNKNNRNKKK